MPSSSPESNGIHRHFVEEKSGSQRSCWLPLPLHICDRWPHNSCPPIKNGYTDQTEAILGLPPGWTIVLLFVNCHLNLPNWMPFSDPFAGGYTTVFTVCCNLRSEKVDFPCAALGMTRFPNPFRAGFLRESRTGQAVWKKSPVIRQKKLVYSQIFGIQYI